MDEQQSQAGWVFTPGQPSTDGAPPPSIPTTAPQGDQVPAAMNDATTIDQHDKSLVSWSASEFVSHQKGVSWFLLLALVAITFGAVIYLITKDTITVGIIVLMSIAFGIAAAKKPRVLNYSLGESFIHIGSKNYSYASFKSFSVAEDEVVRFITLIPIQRFMPSISIYYDPADENKIVDALSAKLPIQAHKNDAIDSLMRKIRF